MKNGGELYLEYIVLHAAAFPISEHLKGSPFALKGPLDTLCAVR
jgi:hypothetical protein